MLVVGDGLVVIARVVEDLSAECVYDSQCGEARAVVAGEDIEGELIGCERSMEGTLSVCNGGFRICEVRIAKNSCGVGVGGGEIVLHSIDRR